MVLYEMIVNGKSEWSTRRAAAVLYESALGDIKFGDTILDNGVDRSFSKDDRKEITELADEIFDEYFSKEK